jgi:hypothetical protein
MTDWYHGLTTAAWSDRAQATFQCAETSARGDADTAAFRPPRRSDAPPEGNVNTLANGERLDTPQRFFDFLECFFRDHHPDRPDLADGLATSRHRAEQRRRRSHN